MIDYSKYKWIDNQVKSYTVSQENEDKVQKFLDILDGKDYLPGKKNILAFYFIDQLSKGNKEDKNVSKLTEKDFKAWYKSASFKKLSEKMISDFRDKFTLSAIVSMMMMTLVIYFIVAILMQNFVISFSIDAIVGCIAMILLVRNLMIRYRMVKSCTKSKDIFILDGAALILCLLLKVIVPVFDFTLVVLVIDHYVTKKKYEKQFTDFINTLKA